ncbi:MAG: hypothetical protein HKN16_03415, partial [Saprospiraceae bacterium]|nr:hypothetical protein [Saprospiraceae bacterium]
MSKIFAQSLIGFCLCLITLGTSQAQSGNCDPSTPFLSADLSSSESATYLSPSVSRSGLCCGIPPGIPVNQCIEFEVTLHPNSLGFTFDIEVGLIPSGTNEFFVDCASPTPLGSAYCTNDPGPFTVTYCKAGSFPNQFRINAIPSNVSTVDVTTQGFCPIALSVSNLVETTVVWNDITGGGMYNSYLDCQIGCSNPIMTPDGSAPGFIDYQVCGTIENLACQASAPVFCDTVRVSILPELTITNVDFLNGFCPTEPGVLITAIPSQTGGDYVYWWSGVGPTSDNTFFATVPGFYNVVLEDQNFPGCSRDTVNFIVFHQTPDPKINIDPFTSCPKDLVTIWSDDAGPGTFYEWDFGPDATPQTASGIGPHIVSFSDCGFQQIDLTVTLGGCQGVVTSFANVQDNQAPVIDVDDVDITLECGSPIPPQPPAIASDNCDNSPSLAFTEVITPGICNQEFVITWTWTAEDECGNVSTKIKEISFEDDQVPTLSQYPLDLTISCDESPPIPPNITAIDNCDVFPTVTYTTNTIPAPSGCSDEFILQRIWEAADDCGNVETHIQSILHQDIVAPTIPGFDPLLTFDCDAPIPGLSIPTPTDDCAAMVTTTYADSPCDNNYLPPYYEDISGEAQLIGETLEPSLLNYPGPVSNLVLTAVCSEVPFNERRWEINNPNSFDVYVDWSLSSSSFTGGFFAPPGSSFFFSPAIGGINTVTLNWKNEFGSQISVVAISSTASCDLPDKVYCNICKIDRTITVSDNCGNTANYVQTLIQQDLTAPIITGIPADVSMGCVPCIQDFQNGDFENNPGVGATPTLYNESVVPGWETTAPDNLIEFIPTGFEGVTSYTGAVHAEVNGSTIGDLYQEFCSIPTTILQISFAHAHRPFLSNNTDDIIEVFAGPNPGALTSLGVFTATVGGGWTVQTVNYTVPVGQLITVFAFRSVQGDPVSPTIGNLIDAVSMVTLISTDVVPGVSDNCDTNVELLVSEQRIDGSCPNEFQLIRTWTAIDDCGNTTIEEQRVSVGDFEAPTLDSL